MNQLLQPNPSPHKAQTGAVNPFARALAETEQGTYNQQPSQGEPKSPFTDALSQTGGNFGDLNNGISPDFLERQQEELLKDKQREAMRKKLHDQINPVDTTALFDAREREVKQQIDRLREDLKMLSRDVSKFEREVELTLLTEVTAPGQKGTYYLNFFHHLRSFIMFLRQKVKSASTWLKASQGKKRKSKQPGLVIGGQSHEKTSTVQDMMHHERSSSYGGA